MIVRKPRCLEHSVRLVASGRVRIGPTIAIVLSGPEAIPRAFEVTSNEGKYRAISHDKAII